jgi:hypothetical protein
MDALDGGLVQVHIFRAERRVSLARRVSAMVGVVGISGLLMKTIFKIKL